MLRAAGTLAAVGATPAWAQRVAAWPDRPVRLIVPYPAGGSTDVLFRILAERLQDKLGQPFVVENRPGASGNVGIDAVAKSPPDGYMIGGATVGHFSINQFLIAKMPYDAEKDLVAPSLTYELPNVAVVAAQHVPANLSAISSYGRRRDRMASRSAVRGRAQRRISPEFCSPRWSTGLNAVHVPFRGAAQTIPAMLAGDVTFAIDNLASYMSLIEAGTMRALAVTSAQRWPTLPNVPTMAEVGVPDFVVTSWAAYVMPIATAPAIVDKLATAQKEIAAEPSTQNRFLAAGARPVPARRPGRGFRRQGNGDVARGGAPLRSDAAVTISAELTRRFE